MNASKYRSINITADKKQDWILTSQSAYTQTSTLVPITASDTYMAYRCGSTGSSVGVVPLSHSGRYADLIPLTMKSLVVSLEFSYHSGYLAVGSLNSTHIYRISDNAPELIESRVSAHTLESTSFHPTAANLIALGAASAIDLWDYSQNKVVITLKNEDKLQHVTWRESGSQIASISVDNNLRYFDPRQGAMQSGKFRVHDKASKALWMGDLDLILTVGTNARKGREYAIWDIRQTKSAMYIENIDSAIGTLGPLYDNDTNLLFFSGRGESKLSFVEVKPDQVQKVESNSLRHFSSPAPIVGACLVPRTALNVMQGEVARILTVSSEGSIVKFSAIVPRKSYLDFHADLFPDRKVCKPSLTCEEWLSGRNDLLDRISMNPKLSTESPKATSTAVNSTNDLADSSSKSMKKHSYFRNVETSIKSVFEDYSIGNVTITNETNSFEANEKYLAFIQSGSGGRVGIWSTELKGRLPQVFSLICGAEVTDLKLDPYNQQKIVISGDDGKLKIFMIPKDGLTEDVAKPDQIISAHSSRVSLIEFHPTIKDLLLSSSPELGSPTIKLFDLRNSSMIMSIGLSDTILCCSFDIAGTTIAAVTRDKKLMTFNLRDGAKVGEGPSHSTAKAARIVFLEGCNALCSVGFGNGSKREFRIYNLDDLSQPSTTILDTSPSILIPHFDMQSKVLMLVGRGESAVSYYEIEADLSASFLNRYMIAGSITTAFSPMSKDSVDVSGVELIHGWRATQTSIDYISVRVPRVRKEYFQDDVLKDIVEYSSSALSISDYLQGQNVSIRMKSVRPPGMPLLSSAPVEVVAKVVRSFQVVISENEKKDASMKAMFEMANLIEGPLKQDLKQGCEDEEWD